MKVQRREATDALRREGEMAVLIDGSLVRLSALSALIWELTDEPMDIERLARALEERFGAPRWFVAGRDEGRRGGTCPPRRPSSSG